VELVPHLPELGGERQIYAPKLNKRALVEGIWLEQALTNIEQ
jgi:hypothetical protein